MSSAGYESGTDWIPEEEVTFRRLRDVFDASFFDVFLDEESEKLKVRYETLPVYVDLMPDVCFVRFLALLDLRGDAPVDDKLRFVNRMNYTRHILPRFLVSDEPGSDVILALHDLSYKGGVSARHMVVLFRKFASDILIGAIVRLKRAGLAPS